MNSFAKRLRELRGEAGLTQEEMAGRIAVPLRTYQNYEAGRYYPKSTEVYARLSREFGLSVGEILGDTLSPETRENGQKQSVALLETARGLFAGGSLSEEDKDLLMKAISDAYWQAKLAKKED